MLEHLLSGFLLAEPVAAVVPEAFNRSTVGIALVVTADAYRGEVLEPSDDLVHALHQVFRPLAEPYHVEEVLALIFRLERGRPVVHLEGELLEVRPVIVGVEERFDPLVLEDVHAGRDRVEVLRPVASQNQVAELVVQDVADVLFHLFGGSLNRGAVTEGEEDVPRRNLDGVGDWVCTGGGSGITERELDAFPEVVADGQGLQDAGDVFGRNLHGVCLLSVCVWCEIREALA